MRPINLALFVLCDRHAEVRGVGYEMGAKVPHPIARAAADLPHRLDCSGYAQWLMFRQGFATFPPGSAWDNQRPWFADSQGLDPIHDYEAIRTSTGLFVNFIRSVPGAHAGHIWFTVGGGGGNVARTIECHGGAGVTSRDSRYHVLEEEFAVGFQLPTV